METRLDQLATALGLPRDQAARLLEEVRTVFHQTLPDFVRSRHGEYKSRMGLRNDEIYRRIQDDIRDWRFRASDVSIRQIRRMIHG
jgi:hypothetical protein